MIKALKILTLLAGIFLGISTYFVYQFFSSPLTISKEVYYFELKRGETLGHLSQRLVVDGLIASDLLLKVYVRVKALDKKLRAGEYVLERGSSLLDLLSVLEEGKTLQRSITFVEGWSYKQLFAALAEEFGAIDEKKLREKLGIGDKHLEGMFFADTYFYSKGQSVYTLLENSHKQLQNVLDQEWEARQKGLPLKNSYEALTLASIVEKETGVPSERPLIAGVFVNRLHKRMRLQTDPTVIYGIGDAYDGNITRKHLKEYTPYNTYRIPALPPTPIAIVGRESINAVMHPKDSQYLYFVAKGDGSHYFSPTLEEHQNAVRKYQWNRKKDYRSSPK